MILVRLLSAVSLIAVPCAIAVGPDPQSPMPSTVAMSGVPEAVPELLVATVLDGATATRGTMSPPEPPPADPPPATLPAEPVTGDCTQVAAAFEVIAPELATVGVRLARRESQCCPQVRGGDVVNSRCQVIRVDDWSHRSDAGLFQFNWVWHFKDGELCTKRGLCGPESITSLSVIDQVAAFAWVVQRHGLCHWSPPNYCA